MYTTLVTMRTYTVSYSQSITSVLRNCGLNVSKLWLTLEIVGIISVLLVDRNFLTQIEPL